MAAWLFHNHHPLATHLLQPRDGKLIVPKTILTVYSIPILILRASATAECAVVLPLLVGDLSIGVNPGPSTSAALVRHSYLTPHVFILTM